MKATLPRIYLEKTETALELVHDFIGEQEANDNGLIAVDTKDFFGAGYSYKVDGKELGSVTTEGTYAPGGDKESEYLVNVIHRIQTFIVKDLTYIVNNYNALLKDVEPYMPPLHTPHLAYHTLRMLEIVDVGGWVAVRLDEKYYLYHAGEDCYFDFSTGEFSSNIADVLDPVQPEEVSLHSLYLKVHVDLGHVNSLLNWAPLQ